MEVPAGQSKHIRLRNLPSGAVLAVRIASTGRVLVALVGGKQLRGKKDGPKPVFRGAVERKLSFKVTIPEADDYYLVFNNRRGSEALSVEAEIRAVRGRAHPPKERERRSPGPDKAGRSPVWTASAHAPSQPARRMAWMRSISIGFTM